MRQYIFRFEQEQAVKLGLNVTELLILDYMLGFFGNDLIKARVCNEEHFFKLSYKKIFSDLPILNIQERQLRNIFQSLEEKKILKRLKNQKHTMFISINLTELFGNYFPTLEDESAENCRGVGNFVPTIENYDRNNKIIIKINNARIRTLNLEAYTRRLHEILKDKVNDVIYIVFLKSTKAINFTKDEITLHVRWKERIEKSLMEPLTEAVLEAFEFFNM